MPVTKGQCVKVHYRGTLKDGTEFDTSAGREPLEFTLGEGQVIPGFEEAVEGMELGDKKTVVIPPDDAYGKRFDEAVQTVPRNIFPEEPQVGEIVSLMTQEGQEVMATVAGLAEDEVTLDFNHPLAGEELTFEPELVGSCEKEA
jgi:peptidylprolyl isomerase